MRFRGNFALLGDGGTTARWGDSNPDPVRPVAEAVLDQLERSGESARKQSRSATVAGGRKRGSIDNSLGRYCDVVTLTQQLSVVLEPRRLTSARPLSPELRMAQR